MQQGIMGDFFLAIDEKKTLVCPVTTVETSTARNKKHAMVMYHFDDENFIFNTSNPFQAMEFKVSILNLWVLQRLFPVQKGQPTGRPLT